MITNNTNIEKEIKEYLNPNERFADRMKASYSKQSTSPDIVSAQKSLFVDDAQIDIHKKQQSKYPYLL